MRNKIKLELFAKENYDKEKQCGIMHFKYVDCEAKIVGENDQCLGVVCGCFGGGIEIRFSDEPHSYYIDAREIWNAMCRSLGKDSLIIDEEETIAVKAAKEGK